MLGALAKKIFGSSNDRRIASYRRRVAAIGALEEGLRGLDDSALRDRTRAFRVEIAAGAKVDDLLVPAFATAREAARRALGHRHFDVQLIGGMVLNEGAIAEMRTGEGKTLVATLAAYLNALKGDGVHVVTVNDYLAARDAATMEPVYRALGMTVGVVTQGMDDDARRAAYACDVTYGTNSEMGFDYLRDNMRFSRADQVQRGHAYALVDEVDSILIDEARTPLVVSGLSEDRSDLYVTVDAQVRTLGRGHYDLDERLRLATLNDGGIEVIEARLASAGIMAEGGLYDPGNANALHHVHQSLRAHALFKRDRDYVVRDGEVVIVDESTGRAMPGRRYAEGLHQAIEAKEGVRIQPETVTLASVTYQNLFRMYAKLSGMTGTAGTEVDEFNEIYGLEVVAIPTNLPVARVDEDDEVYRSVGEKYAAIVAAVGRAHERGQPVLVGTSSVEQSEALASLMVEAGYQESDFRDPATMLALHSAAREGRATRRFAVLNARAHGMEAHIVAQAGVPGAITIATNMAGRGTDIRLGGNVEMRVEGELAGMPEGPERDAAVAAIVAEVEANRGRVIASGEPADPSCGRPSDLPGGLFVIGSERHESRRIDNQLRGRSGRQGDPGRSRFYLSVEDDLVRVFGSDRIHKMLDDLGVGAGEAIVHPIINKVVAKAQSKVEAQNFNQRKDVLKYDDVVNAQRKAVFSQRREIMDLDAGDVRGIVDEMRMGAVDDLVDRHMPAEALREDWDVDGLKRGSVDVLGFGADYEVWQAEDGLDRDEARERLLGLADAFYAQITAANGPEVTTSAERQILLQVVDGSWREHIETLEHLRQGIGLRGIGQRNPLQEFAAEAYDLFEALTGRVRRDVTANLSRVRVVQERAAA